MTTQPVLVPFHQDAISCLPGDDPMDFKVVFKPTCESMGLDYEGQDKRLRQEHWATISVTEMVARDGKVREMTVLNRRTFVMWLATIETRRLTNPAIRAKVERYQLEAAEVLDRHFFGPPAPLAVPLDPFALLAAQHAEMLAAIDHLKAEVAGLKARSQPQARPVVARRPAKVEAVSPKALMFYDNFAEPDPGPSPPTEAGRPIRATGPLGGFLRARCEAAEGARTRLADLHAAYVVWAGKAGVPPATSRWFSVSLTTAGYPSIKSHSVMLKAGIRLRLA